MCKTSDKTIGNRLELVPLPACTHRSRLEILIDPFHFERIAEIAILGTLIGTS